MKHLKTYKIFESVDNFLLDCQDILLELEDNGFDVQFRTEFSLASYYYNHPDADVLAEINISKRDESMYNIYTFGEISETILRLNEFIKLNNKRATAYETTMKIAKEIISTYKRRNSELDDIIKTWGKDYKLRRLTIYLEK